MTTRDGRRERRPGPPLSSEVKQQSSDALVKSTMGQLLAEIQRCLVDGFQGEITFVVRIYDGGVSQCQVGSVQTYKP